MKKLSKIPSYIMNNNKALLVFSLVVSFIIWYVFTLFYNPISTTSIKNVPIRFDVSDTAVDAMGLDIVGYDTDTVTVNLSGKTVVLSGVSASDLVVTPSLSSVTGAGTYEVPLMASPNSLLSDYEIVSVTPSKVKLTFDQVITRTFDVMAEAVGCSAADDLIAEMPVMTESATRMLNVSGGKQDVERIATVVARAQVNDTLSETKSFDADILLLDSDGNEIDSSNMTLGFRSAKITVNISTIRTLPVKPVFNVVPAGLDLSYTLSEKEVTVIGQPEVVKSMESAPLESIDCGLITMDNCEFERNLSLPSGVRVYDNSQNTVTVSVNTSAFASKTLRIDKVMFRGLGSGLSATLQGPQTVTVMGNASDINALTADDVIVTVDVTGQGPVSGKQQTAEVALSDNVSRCWVVTYNKNYLVTFTLS